MVKTVPKVIPNGKKQWLPRWLLMVKTMVAKVFTNGQNNGCQGDYYTTY